MPLKSLEHLAAKVTYETLPANWNTFDLARFSPTKELWEYQQTALKLALNVLWKYYDDFADYETGEAATVTATRKEKLVQWYEDGMLLSPKERKTLSLSLGKAKLTLRELIDTFFPLDEDDPQLNFAELCNRMGFWMATGSGKTLVLVKLLELLHLLMRREEIPVCDVLMLTHREDLLEQFQRTIWEYNHSPDAPVHIELRELREYPEAKREAPGGLLGRDSTLRVFFYRSDNLSDEHKERIVDFRNYDNGGQWYVLLDEAHKGGAEESKRKHIFTILSRAGFLFNFSATFTDVLDRATTVHNFNLSEFISRGYGKHIAVLRQELGAFKKKKGEAAEGDYSDDEKRKIVAKSMLLVAYTASKVCAVREAAGNATLYHHPMLMTLVNSVNTEDADLKLYFEQIIAVGRGEIPPRVWNEARAELWEELKDEPAFLYENKRVVQIAKEEIDALSVDDVLRDVYNAEVAGDIEVLVRPGNRQEIAFKMKTAAQPFALIKIGDVTGWLKEKLTGFEFIETLEAESFFQNLNAPDSSINILMGSRTFYEGWDSNRPNVINFVNIGTGEDAKKFILQSVGRGVRVQSWNDERRRFEELYDTFDDKTLFRRLRELTTAPETLYVLGTNREALQVVLEELKKEKPATQDFLRLDLNPQVRERLLLVPEYRKNGIPIIEERAPSKFEIAPTDFSLLNAYDSAVEDDRLLLLAHGGSPKKVRHFRTSLSDSDTYFAKHSARTYRNMEVMAGRVLDYFGLRAEELDRIRALDDDDIIHFRQISVDKPHAEEIQNRIDRVLFSQTPQGFEARNGIEQRFHQGELDFSEAARLMEDQGLTGRQTYNDDLVIEYLANHYYLPVIASKGKRSEYIRHIIETDSEVRFLNSLREYVRKSGSVLRELDWWMFSKLDQYLDDPYIPYYNPKQNRVARFIPDFIFWMRKGDSYTILFVDPKGMEQIDWERKVDGYKRLFESEEERPKTFAHESVSVSVRLSLFTRDRNVCPEGGYKRFWQDNLDSLFNAMLATNGLTSSTTSSESKS